MVEYSLCICYGFVVNDSVLEKIRKYYNYNDEIEEFVDDYVHCVNAWNGDEYFVGLRDAILEDGESMRFIDDGIDNNFTLTETNNFYDLVTKFKIKEIVGDNSLLCRRMLINFCY